MKTRIDLGIVLPDIHDEQDDCVNRVKALLEAEKGIEQIHVVKNDDGVPQFCLHYESSIIPLARVVEITKSAGATVTSQYGHAVLALRAFDSEDAARRIEAAVGAIPGVLAASVNLAAQLIRVEWDKRTTKKEVIVDFLVHAHYAEDSHHHHHGHACCAHKHDVPAGAPWFKRNQELVRSLAAGAVLVATWLLSSFGFVSESIAILLYLVSYVLGAFDILSHLARSVVSGKFTFDIDLLMLLAAIGSAIIGAWAEGALLLFLFSFAHALEHYALGRARGAIRALAELAPAKATVLRNSGEVVIAVEDVQINDIVLVRPGERIPIDGNVHSGNGAVNQAPITGESIPVEKEPGDSVFAGSINGDGAMEVRTTKACGDRTLDRVIKLVEEAQTQKAPTQLFTERFERVFVPLVLVCDLLLIVIPPLVGFWPLSVSFYRAMAMLVAASPCALALGTPSAVLAGIAQAARRGVLIKGGAHLEQLGALRAIAFDKTGTLTLGKPEVSDVVAFEGSSEHELLRYAGAVENRSQHPLARAVVRRAARDSIKLPTADDVESVTGRGVKSYVEGRAVSLGSPRLWENESVPGYVIESVVRLQALGRSVIVVRADDRWLGVLGVSDTPRKRAKQVLETLRTIGIRNLVMLTGDNKGVGEAVGREVGVDEVRSNLLPEEKVTAIRSLLSTHETVAMVGDGINDAPALAHATVGIAMGGAGTAIALETADVALMSDDLTQLPYAIELSRQSTTIIKQNLVLALSVIGLLIVSTVTGFLGIAPTVALHEGSTLVVIANSLRLLGFRGTEGR